MALLTFGLGETIGKGVYEGIGKVLSGPGIILLATVLAKLGANLLSFVKTSGAQFLGLNKQAEEQARTQSIIGNILAQRPEVMQKYFLVNLVQMMPQKYLVMSLDARRFITKTSTSLLVN